MRVHVHHATHDISKELAKGGSDEVDGHPVLAGLFHSDILDNRLFPEFITSEFETALEEVTCCGGAETGEEGAGAFGCDDLAEGADHALWWWW